MSENNITIVQEEILERHEKDIQIQCEVQANSFMETGRLLKAIKDGKEYAVRGYKTFVEYIESACGTVFPFRSGQAYKYIRVYESYGNRLKTYGKYTLDILDMFREVSDEEFQQIAVENDLENMTVKEAELLKKELDAANEQISFLQSTAKEKDSEIEKLKKRPVDVVVQDPDPEEIKRLVSEQVKDSEKKFAVEKKKLSKKLDKLKKKADSADELKADYENRLQELENKFNSEKTSADQRVRELEEQVKKASGKADEALIEFKFYFSEIQENVKKFLAVCEKLPDGDKKEKFKGAAVKFFTGILEELK